MVNFAQKFERIMSNLDFGARRIMLHENLTGICQVWTLCLKGNFSEKFDGTVSSCNFRATMTELLQVLILEGKR